MSFLQEGSDSNPIGQLSPGKSIPFAQHGLYNDVSVRTSIHLVLSVRYTSAYTVHICTVHSVCMFNAHSNLYVLYLESAVIFKSIVSTYIR